MELNSYFDGLLGNIEPDPKNVTTAKKSHEKLRELLKKDEQISQANPDSFLSGSYARHTAINDIKDVDIILLVDLDYNVTTPDVTIAWLQGAIQNYYSKVRAQGRSVQVTTESNFRLDVVPAVPISHRNGPVRVPDRDAKEWVASHPKGQIAFASQRNEDTKCYYVHLVKIMKYWRDRLSTSDARIKSYALESLVAECILTEPLSYAHAIVDIFQTINQKYSIYLNLGITPQIPDPGYSSVNVAKRLSPQEFSAFLAEVQSSYTIAKAALDSDNETESIKLWKTLFGLKFKPRE